METTKKVNLLLSALHNIVQEQRIIVLHRETELTNATLGYLITKGKVLDTIELPDKQNQRNISRIPPGSYPFTKYKYKGRPALWIRDVPNRSEILVHYGTKPTHSKGCILVKNTDWINSIADKGLIYIR